MFQAVRPNSQVYLFHKTDKPYVEIGFVSNPPVVRPKFPQQIGMINNSQEKVVDLSVKVDNMNYNFPGLPANLEIADTFCNGDNIVISISKEAINAEVMSAKQKVDDSIKNYENNKVLSKTYEGILKVINPEYAEKQEQQSKLEELGNRVDKLSDLVTRLVDTMHQNYKQHE